MKILVIGSGGRLGAALHRFFSKDHECIGLQRGDIDLSSLDSVDSVIRGLDFEVAINCAALTNVDYCEHHPEEAQTVNATAPGRLATLCRAKHAKFIHISTDYVFDGKSESEVTESTPPQPLSIYGRSKLEGEQLVLSADPNHLVVRVSWVFGPDRPSFIDMILERAVEMEEVAAIADKFSSPTYTLDFASYLTPLLVDKNACGILHLCNSGGTSWREYGQHALECAAACKVPLKTTTVKPLSLSEMKNFVAVRPVNTVLSTAKFQHLTGIKPRPWQEAVESYVRDHAAPRLLAAHG